jgi:hypothetical protein
MQAPRLIRVTATSFIASKLGSCRYSAFLWEILCLPASRRGTGFSREGGISDNQAVLNVLASSRLKPVPRHQWFLCGGLPAKQTPRLIRFTASSFIASKLGSYRY